MTYPEPSFSMNVDVTNPGQFFACCGMLEIAHRLWPGAEGWFSKGLFHITATPAQEYICRLLLKNLAEAQPTALAGSSDPKLPPVYIGMPFNLRLDWWLDIHGEKSAFGKMFSGQKRTLTDVRRLQSALRNALKLSEDEALLFDWAEPLKGRFGVDPRAAWEALDVGFSPNDQDMLIDTCLVVELLGAIGLQACPPMPDGTSYTFAAWSAPLCACVSPAAAAGLLITPRGARYKFGLTKRGSYKGFDFAIPLGGKT